jgi:hypothetical protein
LIAVLGDFLVRDEGLEAYSFSTPLSFFRIFQILKNKTKLFKSLTKAPSGAFYHTQKKKAHKGFFLFVRDEGLEPPTFSV